jgi:hypothetical protein
MMKRLYLATVLMMLCLFAAPTRALAYDPFSAVCSGKNAGGSTACSTTVPTDSGNQPIDPLTGPDGILAHITNIVAYIAGAAAIIIIIISALRFVTSGSDVSTGSRTDTDVEDARRSLAGAVIGLVVIALSRTIILYILNRIKK